MIISFTKLMWSEHVAEMMICCYCAESHIEIDVSKAYGDLRYWLNIFDYIDEHGYHPRLIVNTFKWLIYSSTDLNDLKDVRETCRMALDIWTRGYLAYKAG